MCFTIHFAGFHNYFDKQSSIFHDHLGLMLFWPPHDDGDGDADGDDDDGDGHDDDDGSGDGGLDDDDDGDDDDHWTQFTLFLLRNPCSSASDK